MSEAIDKYIETHSKSQGLGFVLTLLLGPLGLFYSSWVAALILCVIAIASAASIIGPIFCWILAIIIGFFAVSKHNEKVKAAAALGVK
jgi:ABC-type phosphate/phosphonate transport system permease subunit